MSYLPIVFDTINTTFQIRFKFSPLFFYLFIYQTNLTKRLHETSYFVHGIEHKTFPTSSKENCTLGFQSFMFPGIKTKLSSLRISDFSYNFETRVLLPHAAHVQLYLIRITGKKKKEIHFSIV